MSSYEMQIKLFDKEKRCYTWKSVRCSGFNGYIYRYPTYKQAHESLHGLYDFIVNQDDLRVKKVNKTPNIGELQ